MTELNNKKAPHLTNLNEDSQLSGKLYYSLANLAQNKVHVGNTKNDPKPDITLRGVGIQENHAHFTIENNGLIKLVV